jgi:hypothetical protein
MSSVPSHPTPLTSEQLKRWDFFFADLTPEPGRTAEQTVEGAISAYMYWCMLEGVDFPSAEDICAHMKRTAASGEPST